MNVCERILKFLCGFFILKKVEYYRWIYMCFEKVIFFKRI